MNPELLKMFCSPEREDLKDPGTIGNNTYATDGIIAIRVRAIPDFPCGQKSEKIDKIDKIFGELVPLVPIGDPSKSILLPKYESVDEPCAKCGGTGICKVITCPSCNGEGEVCCTGPYGAEYEATCHFCEGDGVFNSNKHMPDYTEKSFLRAVERAVTKSNDTCARCSGSGRSPKMESPIDLGDKRFNQNILAKITSRLNNVRLYPYFYYLLDRYRPAYFTFDGGDGIVTPMIKRTEGA